MPHRAPYGNPNTRKDRGTNKASLFHTTMLLASTGWLTACASEPPQTAPTPPPQANTTPAPPPSAEIHHDGFDVCVEKLQQRARNEGIRDSTILNALGEVQFIERVIELDRRQPEYTETFGNYLNSHVTKSRVQQGQKLLDQHQKLFQSLESQYGIPGSILVAFWGLETNFGSYMGSMPIIDSLTTLACDGRRSSFFAAELLNAMQMMDQGAVTKDQLKGSWAGAMGNMQFMPSTFRSFAMDGDQDGRIDLWKSVPDAMTSAANYLRKINWQRDARWGDEVTLPSGFDYSQTSAMQKKSLATWRSQQVHFADGRSLPDSDRQSSILLPSGHTGPAFLVYSNFDVIMKWNRSEYYAISVGHLSDRIQGKPALTQTPPALPRLENAKVKALQAALNAKGFDAGVPDGIAGSGTRAAIRAFQKSLGMIADGYPSPDVFRALGVRHNSE
ncbi:Putative peptidoglycan-binding protein [gamma proteobacterium HdN1]|nr:Putative peptidoglycan-binding protein [gamma proteobacterium HdN1]